MRNTTSRIINFICSIGTLYLLLASSSVFSTPTTYVDESATGLNNGSSWNHAYNDLQFALSNTSSGEIWVAAGNYFPGAVRSDTFELRNDVALYGGFSGNEDARDQRDTVLNETVLNGDLFGDDYLESRLINGHVVWRNLGDNSHHVVTAIDVDATAVLDGFVIVRGWAMSTGFIDAGGGLLIRNGSPTISNTKIDGSVGYYGGGAYVDQGSSPSFTNCEFRNNYGDIGYGGAMHIADSSNVTFNNCHFEGNAAIGTQSPAGYGGALYINFGATATITGSSFIGNITGYRTNTTGGATATKGGAIMAGGDVSVRDSTFIGNKSHYGAAIYAFNNATLINNIFTGNRATTAPGSAGGGYGGAMILTGSSTVVNNTITNNSATEGTGGVIASVAAGESVQIVNTILWGNTVSKYIAPGDDPLPVSRNQLARAGDVSTSYGILEGLFDPIPGEDPVDPNNFPGVLDEDPLFVSQTEGDLHLADGSPAIDSGDNTVVSVATDFDGSPRLQDDPATVDTGNGIAPIVDMGAYEFAGTVGDNIAPVAVVSATPASGTSPLAVTFDASGSYDPDGVIDLYEWTFGDGAISTLDSPNHTYDTVGTYTATLTVTDDFGASRTASVTVTVTGVGNQAPVVVLTSDWIAVEAVAPLLVVFDGSKSTDDSQIDSYVWDFGDGSATGTGDTIKHTFDAGTYTITLTVTDDQGLTSADSVSITVDSDTTPPPTNQIPVAVASSDWIAGGTAPLPVGFDGSTSYDNGGSIVSHSWNFGDGSAVATGDIVEHTFDAGTYTITLTVTDNGDATATDTVSITVDSAPPPSPVETVPTAPTNLTLALVKSGKGKNKVVTDATINWTVNSDNETGFVIESCLEQTTGKGKNRITTCEFTTFATTGANMTSQSVLTESGYRYRVKATNTVGDSAYTNEVVN